MRRGKGTSSARNLVKLLPAILALAVVTLFFASLGLHGALIQTPTARANTNASDRGHLDPHADDATRHDSSHGHSHAATGTTGDVLQKRLEARLAAEVPTGHVGDPNEGFLLASASGQESVLPGAQCTDNAPLRLYEVIAVNVEITLNRFLDHDDQGRMYVLAENLNAVNDEVKRNRAARASNFVETGVGDPGVSPGLQGDAIQPLVLRVNQGECLRITLRNALENGEPASLHLHGSSLYIKQTGEPAIATNPDARIAPGETVTYEWMVRETEQEGTHQFHSHGDTREQTSHGLFGAVIVEPKNSTYFNPLDDPDGPQNKERTEVRSGWQAIIQDPNGSDFRECVFFYHEVGTDTYRPRDRNGNQLSLVDPITHSYAPAGFAVNYRSEPFGNRLELQKEMQGFYDKSLGYSSYAFGDPATPICRSYLDDPVKQRIVHGGSEVVHVHHVHGGAIRWRRQPKAEDSGFDGGFNKFPQLLPDASERLDAQALGPSENYDIENECGAGGCQHSVGDFLMHCHIPHHYVSGMWMMWRVYNTLQNDEASTDAMPYLAELPERQFRLAPAVTSDQLMGATVDWKGQRFQITQDNLAGWVEQQLPPKGVPSDKFWDASVLDWLRGGETLVEDATVGTTGVRVSRLAAFQPGDLVGVGVTQETYETRRVEETNEETGELLLDQPLQYDHSSGEMLSGGAGNLYLNEPESEHVWPGFRSPTPGIRLPFLFDPKTGKLAYPHLRPHLGKRPPFAPNHGPAPFLEPIHQGIDVPQPGENGPWSLAPAGSALKEFVVHAITTPITLNQEEGLVDRDGMLFVLKEQENQVRVDNDLRVPLVIRANAQEEVVDIILKSELRDHEVDFFSKSNMHIHFVQFDVQASDGVITGYAYEQSVRPFHDEGETLVEAAAAGADRVRLTSVERFHEGTVVGVGMDQDKTFEIMRIKEIDQETGELVFDAPLEHFHQTGEIVSYEFVRYRWYPDAQFGTAYFHDHVNAPTAWSHGLFGALIAEPPGSRYYDRYTGKELRSGPIADIHTKSLQTEVWDGIKGSFRELVLFFQDDNPVTRIGDDTGTSFNLRVEPFRSRNFDNDPANVFNNDRHGHPETPTLEAYVGDPVVIRTLAGGTGEIHTLAVNGHPFRLDPSPLSRPRDTVHIGISERLDLYISKAGGPLGCRGEYYYFNGRASKMLEGGYGILQVYDEQDGATLKKLPGRENVRARDCTDPGDAELKEFNVVAVEVSLPMLQGQSGSSEGKVYVLEEDKEVVLSGAKDPEPLVLRANVGDWVRVNLTNETREPVSFYPRMLASDPEQFERITMPGETEAYTFYASPEVGETVALVMDTGDIINHARQGLYASIVIGPEGAKYGDPFTGVEVEAGWRVNVHPNGQPDESSYRDFALFFQDEEQIIGTHIMPYKEQVDGVVGLNYRAEALEERLKLNQDTSLVFRSDVHGDPATPVMETFVSDKVKIHVLVPFSEQNQVFTLEGHQWPLEPDMPGSDLLGSVQVGALEAITIVPEQGAGGQGGLAGDYLYGDHREPYREAGLWGIFRVYAPGAGDTIAPEVVVTGVTDGEQYSEPVAVGFTATDAGLLPLEFGADPAERLTVTATLNGQPFTSGTEVSEVGNYSLVVTAQDTGGNETEVSVEFEIVE